VHFIWDGVRQAWQLLLHPDADLKSIITVSLRVTLTAAFFAMLIGVPLGLMLGLGSFRGRTVGMAFANSGFGLPPVVVGLVLTIMMFGRGPLGSLHLIYTVRGMIVAQFLLDLPIVIALTAAAARLVDPGLITQARALGASRWRIGVLGLREARYGVIVAAIGAIGAGLSEVGAVVLVGGNIDQQTRTMAGAILTSVSAGKYGLGIALSSILLGLVFVLAAVLTVLQQRDLRERNAHRLEQSGA
jgi:tungstate transport system permease protein